MNASYEKTASAIEPLISDIQMESYHRDGFLLIERFLSADVIAALMQETDDVIAKRDKQDLQGVLCSGYWSHWGVFSDHMAPVQAHGEALRALYANQRIMAIAAALAQRPVDATGMSMQVMYGDCGCKQPWHQDHTPNDPELWWINCLFYLTDMHEDNGSLLVLPGTQHVPLDHRLPDYGPIDGCQRIACPAGSVIFLPNGLLHSVDENRTAQVRRALKINYVPSGLNFSKLHEQRYSRGVRRGTSSVSSLPNATTSYWFLK
jgi:ectoine hydroxylase-related dioxygenase (phytanoyl-CoA dioxygenase family)